MTPGSELRVGFISYLNCVPFFHYLEECGFSGRIVAGVPSALNRMLQQGELDISPSSSFEYLLNCDDYLLLSGLSISSCGPVKSVLFFSPCPLEQLQGRRIAITGESATSINLLRVLLLEYVGLSRVDDYVPAESVEDLVAQQQPGLLIGDRAMDQAKNLPAGMHCYDLGELWFRYTGLPFVFALWILRRDSALVMTDVLAKLQQQLECSLEKALADLPLLARRNGSPEEGRPALVDYWKTIDYTLNDRHLAGLTLYMQLCRKHGLLKNSPTIEFFSADKG